MTTKAYVPALPPDGQATIKPASTRLRIHESAACRNPFIAVLFNRHQS